MEPQAENPQPVMDVIAPPAPPAPSEQPSQAMAEAPPQTETKPVPVEKDVTPPPDLKKAKAANSGVSLAIFGTIIIVLALAALATYAYLKSK